MLNPFVKAAKLIKFIVTTTETQKYTEEHRELKDFKLAIKVCSLSIIFPLIPFIPKIPVQTNIASMHE